MICKLCQEKKKQKKFQPSVKKTTHFVIKYVKPPKTWIHGVWTFPKKKKNLYLFFWLRGKKKNRFWMNEWPMNFSGEKTKFLNNKKFQIIWLKGTIFFEICILKDTFKIQREVQRNFNFYHILKKNWDYIF